MCLSFIFDVDDTLYDQLAPFKQAFSECFSFRINNRGIIEEMFKYSRKINDSLMENTQNGKMSVWEKRIFRTTKTFEHFNYTLNRDEAFFFEKSYADFQQKIELEKSIRSILDYCTKKGYFLGVITNGPGEKQRNKMRLLGLDQWIAEENWIISGEVNALKPNPKIFKVAEERLGLAPETSYYIGDSFINDVVGAKKVGWNSIYLNRRSHNFEYGEIIPDYTLTESIELLDAIHEIERFQINTK